MTVLLTESFKSFIQLICWKCWFIQQNYWLSLWMRYWIIYSTDLVYSACYCVQSGTKELTILMSEILNLPLNQFAQQCWFSYERNNCLYLRVRYWIIYSVDLFNNADSYRNKTSMSETLNHSFNQFI